MKNIEDFMIMKKEDFTVKNRLANSLIVGSSKNGKNFLTLLYIKKFLSETNGKVLIINFHDNWNKTLYDMNMENFKILNFRRDSNVSFNPLYVPPKHDIDYWINFFSFSFTFAYNFKNEIKDMLKMQLTRFFNINNIFQDIKNLDSLQFNKLNDFLLERKNDVLTNPTDKLLIEKIQYYLNYIYIKDKENIIKAKNFNIEEEIEENQIVVLNFEDLDDGSSKFNMCYLIDFLNSYIQYKDETPLLIIFEEIDKYFQNDIEYPEICIDLWNCSNSYKTYLFGTCQNIYNLNRTILSNTINLFIKRMGNINDINLIKFLTDGFISTETLLNIPYDKAIYLTYLPQDITHDIKNWKTKKYILDLK